MMKTRATQHDPADPKSGIPVARPATATVPGTARSTRQPPAPTRPDFVKRWYRLLRRSTRTEPSP